MTRRAQPEAALQRSVIQHLTWRARPGVWFTHVPAWRSAIEDRGRDPRGLGTARGTPDLLIVADGKAHFLELKSAARPPHRRSTRGARSGCAPLARKSP